MVGSVRGLAHDVVVEAAVRMVDRVEAGVAVLIVGHGVGHLPYVLHFFFQAEDGIRDLTVTGVQTCALPILQDDHQAADLHHPARRHVRAPPGDLSGVPERPRMLLGARGRGPVARGAHAAADRSEERRVGKECSSGCSTYDWKKYMWCSVTVG